MEKDFKKLLKSFVETNKKLNSSVEKISQENTPEEIEVVLEKISKTLDKYTSFASMSSEDISGMEAAAESMGLDLSSLKNILNEFVISLSSLERALGDNNTGVYGLTEKTSSLITSFNSVTETLANNVSSESNETRSIGNNSFKELISRLIKENKNLSSSVKEASKIESSEDKEIILEKISKTLDKYGSFVSMSSEDISGMETAAESMGLDISDLKQILGQFVKSLDSLEKVIGKNGTSVAGLSEKTTELKTTFSSLTETITSKVYSDSDNSEKTLSPVLENIKNLNGIVSEVSREMNVEREFLETQLMGVENYTRMIEKANLELGQLTSIQRGLTARVESGEFSDEGEKGALINLGSRLQGQIESLERTIVESASSSPNILKMKESFSEFDKTLKVINEDISFREKVTNNLDKKYLSVTEKITDIWKSSTKEVDEELEKIEMEKNLIRQQEIQLNEEVKSLETKKDTMTVEEYRKAQNILIEKMDELTSSKEKVVSRGEKLEESREEKTFFGKITKTFETLAEKLGNIKETGSFIGKILLGLTLFGIAVKNGLIDPKTTGKVIKFIFELLVAGTKYLLSALVQGIIFVADSLYASIEGTFLEPVLKVIRALAPIATILNIFRWFGKLSGVLLKISNGLNYAFGILGKVLGFITKIFSFLPFVGKFFAGFAKIFSFVGKFAKGIPVIGQVLTAVFAVIDGIVGFFKGFAEGGLLGGIKGAFSQIISGLTFGLLSYDVISEFLTPIFDAIGDFFGAIYDFWAGIIGAFGDFFSSIWNIFGDGETTFMEKIGLVFEAAWNLVKNIGKTFLNYLVDTAKALFDLVTYIPRKFGEGMKLIFNKLVDVGPMIWNYVKEIPSMVWEGIKSVGEKLSSIGSMIWNYVKEIPSMVWEGIKNIKSNIFSIPSMIWNTVTGWISSWFGGGEEEQGPSIVSMAWNFVVDWISSWFGGGLKLLGGAASWVSEKAGAVLDGVSGVIGGVSGALSSAASFVGDKVGSVFDGVTNFFGGIGDAMNSAVSWVGEKAGAIVNGVTDAVGSAASWVGEKAGDLWSWGTSWFSGEEEGDEKTRPIQKQGNNLAKGMEKQSDISELRRTGTAINGRKPKIQDEMISRYQQTADYVREILSRVGMDVSVKDIESINTKANIPVSAVIDGKQIDLTSLHNKKEKENIMIATKMAARMRGDSYSESPKKTSQVSMDAKKDSTPKLEGIKIPSVERSSNLVYPPEVMDAYGILDKNYPNQYRLSDISKVYMVGEYPTGIALSSGGVIDIQRFYDNRVLSRIFDMESEDLEFGTENRKTVENIRENKKIVEDKKFSDVGPYGSAISETPRTEISQRRGEVTLDTIAIRDSQISETQKTNETLKNVTDKNEKMILGLISSRNTTEESMKFINNSQNVSSSNSLVSPLSITTNVDNPILSEIKSVLMQTKELHEDFYESKSMASNVPPMVMQNNTNISNNTTQQSSMTRPLRPVDPMSSRLRYRNHI